MLGKTGVLLCKGWSGNSTHHKPDCLSHVCPPVKVVEWELDLTGSMLQIQAAITEILDTLIKDLRRTNKIDW